MINLVKRYPWPSAIVALIAATFVALALASVPGRAHAAFRLDVPQPALDSVRWATSSPSRSR